jgi:hypothetical protein
MYDGGLNFPVMKYELERRAYQKETCPHCGSGPNEYCYSKSGKPTSMHRTRLRLARYIPVRSNRD